MARARSATGRPAAATAPAAATGAAAGLGRGDRARDMLFLVVVIASSTALYLSRLGFAADDWAFLESLTTHGDLSAPGRSVEHDFAVYRRARPVQVVYQALLFGAFGPNPLGYHLVNTAVLALMAMLGYLVLRELGYRGVPRWRWRWCTGCCLTTRQTASGGRRSAMALR
jgi:hypothetical protein